MAGPTITVVVTVLNDRRVLRTLESLVAQTLAPLEILVADGGSKDGTFEAVEEFARSHPTVHPHRMLGNIPETRNQAFAAAQGDLVALLDADEVAPPTWLADLVAPFDDPKVGFTGGPTPALPGTASNVGAAYYNAYLNRFYEEVARRNPHALPMGNSAWRRILFTELGKLDTTLYPRAASEDQEFALRALEAGWKGRYAPDAWVHHDYSGLTLAKMLKKQATYATGGYVVWRRKGSTYEASGGRMAPYLVGPVLFLAALVAFLVEPFHPVYAGVLGALGVLAIGILTLGLMAQGVRGDRKYPGWRYRSVEILRRWATLYGALRGLVQYGVSGRRAT